MIEPDSDRPPPPGPPAHGQAPRRPVAAKPMLQPRLGSESPCGGVAGRLGSKSPGPRGHGHGAATGTAAWLGARQRFALLLIAAPVLRHVLMLMIKLMMFIVSYIMI